MRNLIRKPYRPGVTLAKTICMTYGLYCSHDIAHAVYDLCKDQQIELSYLRFKATCYSISLETQIMMPKIMDITHFHALLISDLELKTQV